jgi:hypothetical protein
MELLPEGTSFALLRHITNGTQSAKKSSRIILRGATDRQ